MKFWSYPAPQIPAVSAMLALALAMPVFTFVPPLSQLRYRPGVDSLTGSLLPQLVHLGTAHLLLNLSGWLILALLAWQSGKAAAALAALATSMFAVALGLSLETAPIAWYVGLSGALYGVFAWLALAYARQSPRLSSAGIAICVLLGVKLLAGLWLAMGPGDWMGIPPAPTAHLYGYAGGLIWAACESIYRALRSR